MTSGNVKCINTISYSTNDESIRTALVEILNKKYKKNKHSFKIIDELGVNHGTARIDLAVVNGFMHGYEIKSDRDTLERLPEQVSAFSKVFDKVTLVVGRTHVLSALGVIPDWWGVSVAVADNQKQIKFRTIRKSEQNPSQESVAIAQLLWREEALQILEHKKALTGVKSKPRATIYQHLVNILDIETLKKEVRTTLLGSRQGWRSDVQLLSGGD
jgi:hypothetical protein